MNSIRFQKSLTFKQTKAVVGIAFFLGILVSTIQIVSDYFAAEEQMGQTVISAMKSVKNPAQSAMFNLDKDIGKDVLVGLFEYPSVLKATLIEEADEFVSLQRKPVDFPLRKYTSLIFDESIHLSIFLDTSSSQNEKTILQGEFYSGQLILVVDTYYEGVNFINRAIFILISGIVRNMLLALLLLLFFHYFITKPVLEIEHALHSIDPKNPSKSRLKPLIGHQNDEFSTLVSGTNQLLEAIEDNIDKRIQNAEEAVRLKAQVNKAQDRESKQLFYQQQLEKKVAERTNDLLVVNQNLQEEIRGHNLAEAEKKKLQSRLQQAQKMESIGTLAGGVAHEINNPINGIMNYAQLIQDKIGEENPLSEYTSEIIHETKRVSKIVKNLLVFARQEKESHSPARIKDIVYDTMSLIQTVLKRDQITLIADISEDLPKIKCRSQQIQQVVMNLITNARDTLNEKYSGFDDNKRIEIISVFFEKDGRRWIRTTVEDRGLGIAQDTMERMFDPFYTTKERTKGTGLGLSISYGIVKDHHGELSVESEPGLYTRFHMDLPVDNGWDLQSSL